MQTTNKKHLQKVALWGGAATLALAAASLTQFSDKVALGIAAGGILSIFNIYSVVRLVEALAGAAEAGVSGKTSKGLTMMLHFMKLGFVAAVLVALILTKAVDVFGFLAGFTAVLFANLIIGFSGLGKDAGGPESAG